jgi:hypothetical protein
MPKELRKESGCALEPAASQAVGTPRSGLVPTAGSSASPDASRNESAGMDPGSPCARSRFESVAGGRVKLALRARGVSPCAGARGQSPRQAQRAAQRARLMPHLLPWTIHD